MTDVNPDPELARLWRLRFRVQDLVRSATRLAEDLRDESEGMHFATRAADALADAEKKIVVKVRLRGGNA